MDSMKFLYEVQFDKGGRQGRCFLIAESSDDLRRFEEREGATIILSKSVASSFGDIFARGGEEVLLVDMTEKKGFF